MGAVTARMGAGIVQVHQLDDAGVRASYGVTLEYRGKDVLVTGAPAAMLAFAKASAARASYGWDQPVWYAASAKAAAKRTLDALAAQAPDWMAAQVCAVCPRTFADHGRQVPHRFIVGAV